MANDICRPKVMYVSVNLMKDYTNTAAHTVAFEFASEASQSFSDLIVPSAMTMGGGVVGSSSIKSFDDFYETNGSSSLMASATVAVATLAAMTLY